MDPDIQQILGAQLFVLPSKSGTWLMDYGHEGGLNTEALARAIAHVCVGFHAAKNQKGQIHSSKVLLQTALRKMDEAMDREGQRRVFVYVGDQYERLPDDRCTIDHVVPIRTLMNLILSRSRAWRPDADANSKEAKALCQDFLWRALIPVEINSRINKVHKRIAGMRRLDTYMPDDEWLSSLKFRSAADEFPL